MKTMLPKTAYFTLAVMILFSVFLAGCVPTAEETPPQREYYEQEYAKETEPPDDVTLLLDFLDSCVGGQYIFGAQGTRITNRYIAEVYENHPEYFTDGRLEYFTAIAQDSEKNGWDFPEDYAWDCSGLWWYAADKLGFYSNKTDRTASDTFEDYCTPITKEELQPGDLLFCKGLDGKIVHMGIMGRQGYIYEAASSFVGVVCKRTIDRRIYQNVVNDGLYFSSVWNVFGRPKIFE